MPALVTLPIIDGNGDGLIDGTSISIHEAEVAVLIVGGVVGAIFAAPELTVALIVDLIAGAIIDILANHEGGAVGMTPEQAAMLLDIDTIIQTLALPNGLTHQQVKDIQDKVTALGTDGVPWPTDAPDWYVPPSGDGLTAGDIWGSTAQFPEPGNWYQSVSMATLLMIAAGPAFQAAASSGMPLTANPDFSLIAYPPLIAGILNPGGNPDPFITVPNVIDWSLLLADDTMASFLQRTEPDMGWGYSNPPLGAAGSPLCSKQSSGGQDCWFLCNVTPATFDQMKAERFPPSTSSSAEVSMPPIADPTRYTVEIGTPITSSMPFVHTGDCDGALVACPTHGRGLKAYVVGDRLQLAGAGSIGFFGPSGYIEPAQYITWDRAQFAPKTMARAAGFAFLGNVGLSYTVTPYTLVPIT